MANTSSTVNSTMPFGKTKLIDRPVQTIKNASRSGPNPFTGLGSGRTAYAKKHHLLAVPPATVKQAVEQMPPK